MHQFERLNSKIAENLSLHGEPKALAAQVKKLSDLYIRRGDNLSGIWQDRKLAQAYIAYFLPLNLLRLKNVYREAKKIGFFSGMTEVVDFGSGPGTAELAAHDEGLDFTNWIFIEKSLDAQFWHKQLLRDLNLPSNNRNWAPSMEGRSSPQTLVIASYSINELSEWPSWMLEAEALMIVEPSNQEVSRRLQIKRQELLDHGYYAWAPCTHQKKCPLLEHSKSDWCHTRVHVDLPKRLKEIENYLPMKNDSLTYSYLLMRRTPPSHANEIRVIGDTLYERGKVRQAVCRNSNREFLTWLTRYGEPQPIPRGEKLTLPAEAEEKGNEIRMPPNFTLTKGQ